MGWIEKVPKKSMNGLKIIGNRSIEGLTYQKHFWEETQLKPPKPWSSKVSFGDGHNIGIRDIGYFALFNIFVYSINAAYYAPCK